MAGLLLKIDSDVPRGRRGHYYYRLFQMINVGGVAGLLLKIVSDVRRGRRGRTITKKRLIQMFHGGGVTRLLLKIVFKCSTGEAWPDYY